MQPSLFPNSLYSQVCFGLEFFLLLPSKFWDYKLVAPCWSKFFLFYEEGSDWTQISLGSWGQSRISATTSLPRSRIQECVYYHTWKCCLKKGTSTASLTSPGRHWVHSAKHIPHFSLKDFLLPVWWCILRMFENGQQYKYFHIFCIKQIVLNMRLQRFIEQHYGKDALVCESLKLFFIYL